MKIFQTFIISFLIVASATSLIAQQAAKASSLETKIVDLGDTKYASTTLDQVLEQYKGKVVYLDFWASWCSPCRKEMPYSLELQKKYLGKDVVFIYMSTDKNAQSWLDMVEQLQLTGMNYRASEAVKMQIYNKFNLQYIPRYILIDKNGDVINANAKRPSNPAIVTDIDKLL